MSFHVKTLGCKLNQFDSAAVEADLRSRGLLPAGRAAEASVVVINTCTVTHRADADARALFRRVRRENPGCLLVATGCLAERDPGAVGAMPEVDLVVRRADREHIGELIATRAETRFPGLLTAPGPAPSCTGALRFGERTRALLKVQEGCDLRCAYCVIPQVRGPSRSVAPEEVEAGVRGLIRSGYREIVLTGVNTGDYGLDLSPRTTLAALLRRILSLPGLGRLRLNSLEPRTVSDEIVDLLAEDPRLAPHLQIPLQSGSNVVLREMRRNYRSSFYAELVARLRHRIPHIGLGADLIVGHPGEGDPEFEETLRFVAGSPLNYLHVFSYSARPGTPTAGRRHSAPERVIKERSARLRALGDELSLRFHRGFLGRPLEVLAFHEPRPDGRLKALSGNFIEVGLEAAPSDANRLLQAVVEHVTAHDVLARPATVSAGSSGR